MPDLNADAALVGPAQPPMVRSDPPGVWDLPPEDSPDVSPNMAMPPPPQPEEPEVPQEDLKPREFDARARDAFHGLLWIGHLSQEVQRYGHIFKLVTPSGTERIQIGQVIAEWRNTLTEEVAFMQATVAAFLVSVDGVALPEPVLNHPKETALQDRFTWVGENFSSRALLNELFQECLILDQQSDIALEAMGKALRQPG